MTQAARADAAFGTELFLRLGAGGGNVVFSPASIAAALRMALTGARGDTAAELARALHLAGPEDAADGLRALGRIRPGDDLTFRAPNTLWIESALSVRDDFLALLADAAAVSVARCDFRHAPEAARQVINDAVAEQTAGKITGLIPPGTLGTLTRLVLVNAVYLNALWVHQFPEHETAKKPFYPERSGVTPTDMMHLQARLAYCQGDGYQGLLLPYRGGPLAMAVVLPDGPLSELAARLPQPGGVGGLLDGLLSAGAERLVDLTLPRFRVEAAFVLNDTLQALGVRQAFSADFADFSGITDAGRLCVSRVLHKACIDVGEKGTEAAAATAVVIRTISAAVRPRPEIRLVADRPFLFAIVDTDTGLPLFLGQFTRPARLARGKAPCGRGSGLAPP